MVVPCSICDVDCSLVVHVITALVLVILPVVILESTGAVVSAVPDIVFETSLEYPLSFPEES